MPDTVFPYPGGKTFMSKWILPKFPRHTCYVEPFGGGASMLVNKPPSDVEVYNDRDGDVVQFFRVLRESPDELVAWLNKRPYAKDLHEKYGKQYYDGFRPDDDIERAGRFFYLRQSQFASKYNGYSGFSSATKRNEASGYYNSIDQLHDFANRFRNVQIENRDYETVVGRYDSNETLFYCDPPYVEEGDGLYTGPSFDQDRFVSVMNDVEADVIISYTDIPAGFEDWRVVERETSQHMNKGHKDRSSMTRVERLLLNFDPQQRAKFSEANQSTLSEI